MKFGKLENGVLIYAPKTLTIADKVHYHPSDEMYLEHGFKPIIDTPYPEPNEGDEIKHYVSSWEESGGEIVKVWTESVLSEEVSKPTVEDRLIAVEADVAETKEALDMILSGVSE